MDKHTPGPREQLEGWTTRCGCHVNTMSELEYCPTHAAATEMYEALRAIVFQVIQGKVLERDACIGTAQALLAKIEGGK
jgi:hypothetical protein